MIFILELIIDNKSTFSEILDGVVVTDEDNNPVTKSKVGKKFKTALLYKECHIYLSSFVPKQHIDDTWYVYSNTCIFIKLWIKGVPTRKCYLFEIWILLDQKNNKEVTI